MADVEGKFLYKTYWTPAKMLLLADVDEISFDAEQVSLSCWEVMATDLMSLELIKAVKLITFRVG